MRILLNIIKLVKIVNIKEETSDSFFINFLNKNKIHYPDSRILLDAYRTSTIVKTKLSFITFDNTILKTNEKILKLFNDGIIPTSLNTT